MDVKIGVIYASHFGNTRQVAEAMADRLRAQAEVELAPLEDVPADLVPKAELLFVGGPIEGHRMTEIMAGFLGGLADGELEGKDAAAFDTRLRWLRWLSGSAAAGIAAALKRAGARLAAPAESFFVQTQQKGQTTLKPGELERARDWADALAASLKVPAG